MVLSGAKTIGFRLALALAAALAAFGAWQLLAPAQLLVGPVIATLVLWPVLYFALYGVLGPRLATDLDPLRPGSDEGAWVGIAAFVLALLAVDGLVFVTLGPPVTTAGTVQDKLLRSSRFLAPVSWRLVLDEEHHFQIPYAQGITVKKGRAVSYTHRDAWLGVRIVTGYDLGK